MLVKARLTKYIKRSIIIIIIDSWSIYLNTTENLTFYKLGVAPKILGVLDRLQFITPTPIQAKSIPIGLEGKDMMGIAQTGTGKTLAFGIPMLQQLSGTNSRGLIIVPTRELALQVEETIYKIGRTLNIKTAVLIGGASMGKQNSILRRNPNIIVGTPGRLNDHLEQKTLNLSQMSILVLDEADRMLDMGFSHQIEKIIKHIPAQRQTLLFSATMPVEIIKLANSYMKLPIRVEIEKPGTAASKVKQEVFFVKKENKNNLLQSLLSEYKGSVLVFSRTKHGASKISKALKNLNISSTDIHSNKSLSQRRAALDGFKSGRYRVLVATDIAARGIDVEGIQLVVNFDLPEKAEDYVHRIGRTGRAGQEGNAVSFATPDQISDVRKIEKLIRSTLRISKHEQFSTLVEKKEYFHRVQSRAERPNFQSSHPRRRHKSSGRSFRSRRYENKNMYVDFRDKGRNW